MFSFTPRRRAWLASPHQYLVERFQFCGAKFDESAGVLRNHPAHGAGELPDGTLPVKHIARHVCISFHPIKGVLLQTRYGPANGEAGLAVWRGQFVERHVGALVASNDAFDNMRFPFAKRD